MATPQKGLAAASDALHGDIDDNLSRAEFAYRRLLTAIRTGELQPGQRLRETELAEVLNVSRTPIREAIRRLTSEGLVTFAPSRGTMVTELDKQQVQELYTLRATLEGTAARLAAQHASQNEVAAMREMLAESKKAGVAETAHLNRQFHQAIYNAAHNRYLERALAQMSDWLALLPGTTFQVQGRPQAAHSEHMAVLEAIQARDMDAAERLARQHIENAGAVRLRMMFAAAGA